MLEAQDSYQEEQVPNQDVIPQGEEADKLIKSFRLRARISGQYMQPFMTKAARMYKIYRSFKEKPEDEKADESLEPNISVGYAFGIVENLLARATEPMFNMKPPCLVRPQKAEHEEVAEGFTGYARKFYSRVDHNLNYILSNRECVITGWAWESDEYAQRYCKGKRWVKKQFTGNQIEQIPYEGQTYAVPMQYQYEKWVEEEYDYPDLVGFNTRFPSVFDVFPEPGVRNVKDMHWLIEQQRNVALIDLEKEQYVDPQTGELTNRYDLSQIRADQAAGEKIKPVETSEVFGFDMGSTLETAINQVSAKENDMQSVGGGDDLDRVHLYHVHEPNLYYCIANGKYIISYVKDPHHRPKIKYRLKVYTQDNLSPFGIGAIEPAEHMLHMVDDTENLTMQNWIRLVNKMVGVRQDAIVSFDDFEPRAGGVVRVRNTQRVSDVIFPYDHSDSTGSMLNHQSNLRGFIEWQVGAQDYSPGTEGTKQEHKTATGQVMIQDNLNLRFAVNRIQFLAYSQDQMENMQDELRQHQFDPVSVMVVDEYGKSETQMAEREDILADDDFDFVIEHDPSWGSELVKRQMADEVLRSAIEYNTAMVTMVQSGLVNPMDMQVANITEAYRKKLQLSGYADTSKMLQPINGIMAPEKKFQAMTEGQQFGPPNPNEDLTKLVGFFAQAISSPEYQLAVQNGKITPEADLAIKSHLQAAQLMGMQALQNPLQFNQAKQMAQQGAQA